MESLGDILKRLPLTASRKGSGVAPGEAPLPEDPACPVCRGAGFVHPVAAGGKPDYSRVTPCECALRTLQDGRRDVLHRYSGLGPLADRTFDNFLVPGGEGANDPAAAKLARAAQAARAFAGNPEGWLVLVGPSGAGKTHLAAAIANYRLARGQPAVFIGVADLLDHLRAAFHPSSAVSYDELFERVKNAPLLILDDLGQQSATPWSREKLDQVINHRFHGRLPTVFTTSLPLADLEERWNTRLADPKLSQVIAMAEKAPSPLGDISEMGHLKNMSFDNFKWKRTELRLEDRQTLETAFVYAREFARQPDGWLVLEGPHGCGKTHLAAAVANLRRGEGKPAVFMFVPDLLDHLRSTFSAESKVSYDEFFEHLKKAPLLVLDDLGGHAATPWAQEKLYQLINYRYNARLPTVFTIISRNDLHERLRCRLDDASLVIFTPPITVPYYSSEPPPEPKPGRPRGPGRRPQQ
ncbi:MAG: ATP-binding protein [Chloroflexi bacterium]|nr:ATP-binding protein [Chloroflexota bacterium]